MSRPLHPAWRDHRNRRRAVLVTAAAFAVTRAAAIWLEGGRGTALLAASAATACVAALVWLAGFRCPFCARHFHWTWLLSNPFATRCLHCGFERPRDPDAGRAYVAPPRSDAR